jgi:hypothetical protein
MSRRPARRHTWQRSTSEMCWTTVALRKTAEREQPALPASEELLQWPRLLGKGVCTRRRKLDEDRRAKAGVGRSSNQLAHKAGYW